MGSGTDAPPDKPDADRKRGFDDAWTELLGAAPDARAEAAAAVADTAVADAPDPGDSVSALADEIQGGRTAEPDVALGGGGREHDATMATMMSGSWAMATRDASPTAAGPIESRTGKDLRESDAEMAAIMGAELDAALARHKAAANGATRSAPKPEPVKPEPAPRSSSPREPAPREPASREPSAERDEAPKAERPRAITTPPRRMVAPEPRRSTGRIATLPEEEPRGRLSLGWAAAAGVVIAGAIWWFQHPPDAAPKGEDAKRVASSKTEGKRSDAGTKPAPTRPTDRAGTPAAAETRDSTASDRALPPDVDDEETKAAVREPPPTEAKPPTTPPEVAVKTPPVAPTVAPAVAPVAKPGGDPRTPPPGTPPDIAAVFVRLPVSPADLPPVGGVGATGVHVDRVEMGASYDKTGCGGVADRFSLAATERVNVCLRVVHPRAEETVSIVWQKNDDSTSRRGKIAIKPLHAYRTRAYLLLRKEYVGDWTVRILSADGVELASHAFTIAP